MGKASTITRLTENYDAQTERLKKMLEDSYGAKLSEMQKKHSELEKQVADATQQYEQSSKKIKDLQSFRQNMQTSLEGHLKQKESDLKALKKAKEEIEQQFNKKIAEIEGETKQRL